MMTRDSYRSFEIVLRLVTLLMLAYIPLAGFPDLIHSIRLNTPVARSGIHSHFLLLLIRDILAILCQAIAIVFFLRNRVSFPKLSFLPAFLLVFFISLGQILVFYPFVGLSGLKTYEYLGMFFVFYFFFSKDGPAFNNHVSYILIFVVFVELVATILQLRYMQPFEGKTFLGSRTIGTFNNPNTIGSFCSICAFFFLFLSRSGSLVKGLANVMLIFICLTSGSRISIFTLFFIQVWWLLLNSGGKVRTFFIITGFGAIVFLLAKINLLAGRSVPTLLGDKRWQLYVDALYESNFWTFLFGKGVGSSANIVFALSTFLDEYFLIPSSWVLSESTFVAFINQLGVLGLTTFYLLLLSMVWQSALVGIGLFLTIFFIGLSNSWLDLYPFNMIAILCLGKIVAEQHSGLKKDVG